MSFSYRRLMNSLRWDIQIQFRYGFYYAAVVMMITWIAALYAVDMEVFKKFIPLFLLSNLNLATFFYGAAIILYEKGERTLEPLQVSPQTFIEYLGSKSISLILLGVIENLIILLVLFWGVEANFFWIIIGIITMSLIYTIFGVGFAVGYKGMSDFLFPAIFMIFVLEFPGFSLLGLTGTFWNVIYHILPLYPMMVLASFSITSISVWEMIYGVLGTIIWIYLAFRYARSRYERFIVRKEVAF